MKIKDDKVNKLSRTDNEVDELLLDAMIIAGCHESIKNENIKKRDDISFTDEFDEGMKKIFQRFKDEDRFRKRRENIRKIKSVANKITACFAILVIISILSVTTSEAARIRFINTYVEVFDVKTEFVFTSEEQITENLDNQLDRFGYIPDGFTVVSTVDEDSITKIRLENSSGEYIFIRITGEGVLAIDTEDANVKEETIGSYECFIVEKNGIQRVIFLTEDDSVVTISGDIKIDIIKKIVKNMK